MNKLIITTLIIVITLGMTTLAFGVVVENASQKRYTSKNIPSVALLQKNFEMIKAQGAYKGNVRVYDVLKGESDYTVYAFEVLVSGAESYDHRFIIRYTQGGYWVLVILRPGYESKYWYLVNQ